MKSSFFCAIQKKKNSDRGSLLVLSATGVAGGPPVHHGASHGPSAGPGRAPWHMLCGLSSREIWQETTGSLSAELEPTRLMEISKTPVIYLFCALLRCTSICYKYQTSPQTLYTVTQPRHNSSRASSFSLSDMNRDSAFCVCHPRILQQAVGNINTKCGSI